MAIRKGFFAFVLILVLTASLATGCGSSSKPDSTTAATSPAVTETSKSAETTAVSDQVKADITWWEYANFCVPNKDNGIYENEMVADFTKDNPGINVKVEMIPWNGGPAKINIAIASKTMPDLIFDYPGRIAGYSRQNVLVPLDDMVTESNKSDIADSIWSQGTYDGKLYMYPIAADGILMAVNKTLFEQIGALDLLPLDKKDRIWTIDDFEKAMEAVKTKAKGVTPAVLYAKNEQGDASIRMLIQNFGADFVSADHKSVVINSDAGIKGMQWLLDMYKKGYFAQGAESLASTDAGDLFNQGKAAFSIISSAANIQVLKSQVKEGKVKDFDAKLIPLPCQPGASPKVEVSVYGFCVFDNKDQNKAAATKKLIDYICNSEKYGRQNVKASGCLPIKASMTDLLTDPEAQFTQSMLKYGADNGYTINNYAQVRAKWYPILQSVLVGGMAPKDALDKFAKDATEIINQ